MVSKEYLQSIGAGDCPKHGRWYGLCHSCAREQRKKDEERFTRKMIDDNQKYRDALNLIISHAGSPDPSEACRLIIKTAMESLKN